MNWLKKKILERRWGELGLSKQTVIGYIRKNDKVELNVPLQILRGLVDEVETAIVQSDREDAITLAEKMGMLKAYYKAAMRLREVLPEGKELIKAGGMIEGGE